MATKRSGAIVECWEQLHEAVMELATGGATPRQRLLAVAERQLLVVAELGCHLNDAELAKWIARFMSRLSGKRNRPSRCAIFSTINAMSDDDVDELLMEIVALYDEVTRCEMIERMRSVAA
jgi:hypothetical protein